MNPARIKRAATVALAVVIVVGIGVPALGALLLFSVGAWNPGGVPW